MLIQNVWVDDEGAECIGSKQIYSLNYSYRHSTLHISSTLKLAYRPTGLTYSSFMADDWLYVIIIIIIIKDF